MGDEQVEIEVEVRVAGGDAHAGLAVAPAVEGRPLENALVDEAAVALVDPQVVRVGVVRHVEIHLAIVVEVGSDDPQAGIGDRRDAGRGAHVLETGAAPVVQQHVAQSLELGRSAEVAPAAVLGADPLGIEGDVAGDVDVEIAVMVEVDQGGGGGPAGCGGAPGRAPVGKDAVAVVQQQAVRADAGEVEVDVAVVVEVAGGGAHAVAIQPGVRRRVDEAAVVLLQVEAVAAGGRGGVA